MRINRASPEVTELRLKIMIRNLFTVVSLHIALGWSAAAPAGVIIFSDNFAIDDATVWDEEVSGNGVGVNAGSLYMSTGTNSPVNQPARAAVKRSVDATGYENITVSFDYVGYSSNLSTDLLYFGWDLNTNGTDATDEGAWNNIPGGGLFDNSYSTGSLIFTGTGPIGLGSGADNAILDVMLWFNANGQHKTYRIDNFVIMGDDITEAVVPVLTAFPLLGTGLGLLGLVGSCRKRVGASAA